MRADEYVVKELLMAKAEIEQYKDANFVLREQIRELNDKYKKVISLFACEKNGTTGYSIVIKEPQGFLKNVMLYDFNDNPSEIDPNFMEWLKVLDLSLPMVEPNPQELEKDQELVDQALEKAKELQDNAKGETND